MAIKGKSKPKGGAKPVTRGPRPTYVPVHTPLMRRRSFWYTVLGVVVLASAIGIWYGLAQQREADREEALARSLRDAATEYRQQVDPIVTSIGTPVAPSGIDVFPEFATAVSSIADGEGESADLEPLARATAEAAKSAAEDLDAIKAVELVAGKGFQEHAVLYVINSKSRMVQALKLYEQAALLSETAAAATGDDATELAKRASQLVTLAQGIFGDGYQDYVEFQFLAGIFQPTVATGTP